MSSNPPPNTDEQTNALHRADVARIIAWNPTLQAGRAAHLAINEEVAALAAVALDPNTPVEQLVALAGRFPREFCENPIFPLLLLENPNLPAEMPEAAIQSILRYAGVPSMFLQWIVAYGTPRAAERARLHVALAGDAGDDWQREAERAIWRSSFAGYENGPGRKTLLPASAPSHELAHDDTLLELIALGAIPAWLLPVLVANSDAIIREAIARGPNVPPVALRLFRRAGAGPWLRGYSAPAANLEHAKIASLAEGGSYARRLAARNRQTPAALLDQLADDGDACVRQFTARNHGTPPATLARLATDRDAAVRQQVGRNPRTPETALSGLADDPKRDVRFAVARNSNTPAAALEKLARDRERVVRQGVARNPGLSPALHATLASDPHPRVRLMAASAAERRQRAASADQPLQAPQPIEASGETGMPVDLLATTSGATLAADADWRSRAAVARGLDTPPTLLRTLAEDDDARVRAAVAGNPHTPRDTLNMLVDDEARTVWRALAENPVANAALLERLVQDYTYTNLPIRLSVVRRPQLSAAVLERLADDQSPLVRRLVLEHPLVAASARQRILTNAMLHCLALQTSYLYHIFAYANPATPLASLSDGLTAHDWIARYALCLNPATPPVFLALLAEDGNRFVRAAARSRLFS